MKNVLNGFQCDKCRSIYPTVEQAVECEIKDVEQPLLSIGDILIDTYEDGSGEFKIRVSEIYYSRHEVNYRFDMLHGNNTWIDCNSCYGNEMLIEYYEEQLSL